MIESVLHYGRLGNRIHQIIFAGILAKELNLYIGPELINLNTHVENYWNIDIQNFKNNFYLNPSLHEGEKLDLPLLNLTSGMNLTNIDLSTYTRGRYKIACVVDAISQSVQCDFYKKYYKDMKQILLIKNKPEINDGVFVHCRLEESRGNIDGRVPPRTGSYEYYDYCLSKINKPGYISAANPDSYVVTRLIDKYKLTLVNKTPAETIVFGSSFKNLILDSGSFSWLIGLFSDATVKYLYWPPSEHSWTGNFPIKLDDFNLLTM